MSLVEAEHVDPAAVFEALAGVVLHDPGFAVEQRLFVAFEPLLDAFGGGLLENIVVVAGRRRQKRHGEERQYVGS